MITNTINESKIEFRAEVASDGTHKVYREGAPDGGPQLLDNEALEKIAGGWSGTVTFPDGCTYTVDNVGSWIEALEVASVVHSMAH